MSHAHLIGLAIGEGLVAMVAAAAWLLRHKPAMSGAES